MAVGAKVSASDRKKGLADAEARVKAIPDLLVEAQRVVNTVIAGWHGRKKRGPGETFWQFRPFVEGDSLSRVDWRRSAKDDHIYIRDREWEAAQTVWLWCDLSPSMLYQSTFADTSKEERAIVITLALAEILSRSGERIAFPSLLQPFAARNGAEKLAAALMQLEQATDLPDTSQVKRFSEVVLVSDFLHSWETLEAFLDQLGSRGARVHLVQIADPAEQTFPYTGRTEFRDPETGAMLLAGRAETYAEDYRRLYLARQEALANKCRSLGWSFVTHKTDGLTTDALLHLHNSLSAERDTHSLAIEGASA